MTDSSSAFAIRVTLAVLAWSTSMGCAVSNHPVTNTAPKEVLAVSPTLGWLTGCWQTVDGSTEEFWRLSASGEQLFGYSITQANGQQVFFEQLRIDLNNDRPLLHAYPSGVGPTTFEGDIVTRRSAESGTGGGKVIFNNNSNDYPQRITYEADESGLSASIALADGTNSRRWRYVRCSD